MLRLLAGLLLASTAWAQAGAALFAKHCAVCHRAGTGTRAPLPEALRRLSREALLGSLESGSMKAQGALLSAAERAAIADFLAMRPETRVAAPEGTCAAPTAPLKDLAGWNGWGVDLRNTRFQPAAAAGLRAEQVARLRLRWAFGFPKANSALGQPTIAGGRVLVGSEDGSVYSLEARSGCVHWVFKASATVRTAIVLADAANGRRVAYFGDYQANVYAVDAERGELLWKAKVDAHPFARITGAPQWHAGRLYVPVSSVEEVPAANAKYACCTFRGSVVALEADTGRQLWKTYAIPEAARPTRVNAAGTQLQGPAGAAIWSSPTLDLQRKAIYVATGNSYADPADSHTDAVLALDLESGALRWSRQMTPGDGWNFSCINPSKASCPESAGQDLDFGSSPILAKVAGGRELLLASQKSGVVHALDPEREGAIVWQTRVGRGGPLGGLQWGGAADGDNLYVALSDLTRGKPELGGGLFALRIATGEKVWQTAPPRPACLGTPGCSAAQLAPVSAIAGVVFSGSMDGHLRAYRASDGNLLWEYDTLSDYKTVNGVDARGGSLSASGATIAGGMLLVNSGYGALAGMPGNVLLAFGPE